MVLDDLLNILPIEFLIIGALLFGGLVIGYLVENFLYPQLNKGATKRGRRTPKIILNTLRGETIVWFILASLYVIFGSDIVLIDPGARTWILRILNVILILSVSWFVLKATLEFTEYYIRRGSLPKTSIFDNLIRISVVTISLVFILNTFNISVTPILTALGVGGIAIALALQNTLSNLISGISILTARQINPGDYVVLATGEEGFIEDVSWRNTTIRSIDDATIIIPNKNLGELIVTNYSLPITEINLRIPVGVSYESDLVEVERVAIEVAKEVVANVEGGVPNVDPFVRYKEFSDSSINFNVVLRIRSYGDLRTIRHSFIKLLHARFNDEGINIPFPIRTVYLRNEEES